MLKWLKISSDCVSPGLHASEYLVRVASLYGTTVALVSAELVRRPPGAYAHLRVSVVAETPHRALVYLALERTTIVGGTAFVIVSTSQLSEVVSLV